MLRIIYETWCTIYCVTLSPAPPLTIDRVYEAVKGVKNWRGFGDELCLFSREYQYRSDDLCVKAVVEKFLRGESYRYPHPSWRAVIWALDETNEIHLADKIIDYGEPVQGEWSWILYVYWDGYSVEALKSKTPCKVSYTL